MIQLPGILGIEGEGTVSPPGSWAGSGHRQQPEAAVRPEAVVVAVPNPGPLPPSRKLIAPERQLKMAPAAAAERRPQGKHPRLPGPGRGGRRSEEHTSELQSH